MALPARCAASARLHCKIPRPSLSAAECSSVCAASRQARASWFCPWRACSKPRYPRNSPSRRRSPNVRASSTAASKCILAAPASARLSSTMARLHNTTDSSCAWPSERAVLSASPSCACASARRPSNWHNMPRLHNVLPASFRLPVSRAAAKAASRRASAWSIRPRSMDTSPRLPRMLPSRYRSPTLRAMASAVS